MNKIKIKRIYINNVYNQYDKEGNPIINPLQRNYEFEMLIKYKGKKQWFKFLTHEKYGLCFVESQYYARPIEDKEERRAFLIEAFGEFNKYLAKIHQENIFIRQDKEEREKRWKEEQERKAREIALGEQVSIEKYLKNQEQKETK